MSVQKRKSSRARIARKSARTKRACATEKFYFYRYIGNDKTCLAYQTWARSMIRGCAWSTRAAKQGEAIGRKCDKKVQR